jgi:NTP pyrophosphatase (non-canonical NTP hydrolase)
MENFKKLLEIVRRKSVYDLNNPWYSGPESYLQGLKDEVDEVIEEIPRNRSCYLEDELGDLLWNSLNAVFALEKEYGITLESVMARACLKFETRLAGIEAGRSWQEIKDEQKQALAREHASVGQGGLRHQPVTGELAERHEQAAGQPVQTQPAGGDAQGVADQG